MKVERMDGARATGEMPSDKTYITWSTADQTIELFCLSADGQIKLYGKPSTISDVIAEIDRITTTLSDARAMLSQKQTATN